MALEGESPSSCVRCVIEGSDADVMVPPMRDALAFSTFRLLPSIAKFHLFEGFKVKDGKAFMPFDAHAPLSS